MFHEVSELQLYFNNPALLRYYNFILIMDKSQEFVYTEANIDFGQTTDTPSINYALALDMDKKVIRIPYSNSFIPISELTANYLHVTSNKAAFKDGPCFRILQGKKKLNIASPQTQLISLGLNLKEVCFRVEDKAFPNPYLSDITNFLSGEQTAMSKDDKIILTVVFEGNKIVHSTSNKRSIKHLKQELCKTVQKQAKVRRDMLLLQVDGSLMSDDKIIEDYGLQNKQIRMAVQKKEGCYRGSSLILTSNSKYVEIKSIKKGDKIKVFNRDTLELQDSSVASVYTTMIDECVLVRLKNNVEIYTTANHLFMCEDGAFRLVKSTNLKEVCLRQHDYLRLITMKTVQITEIRTRVMNEVFYNVVTQGGNNLIINDVISHHFYVKVQAADKIIHTIDTSPFDSILKIKEKLQVLYSISLNNQKLSCFAKQLNDNETISDKNLSKETVVNFSKKICEDWFNSIHNQSEILCAGGVSGKLNQLVADNSKVSYFDIRSNQLSKESGAFYGTAPVKVDQFISITLDSSELRISADSYILLEDDRAILGLDLYKASQNKDKKPLPGLKVVNGQKPNILKVSLVKQKTFFHKLKTNSPNFITSGLVLVKEVIHIVIRKSGRRVDKLCICVTKDLKIGEIKERVAKLTKIDVKNQFLSFNGSFLENAQTLAEKNITSENVLIIDNCEKLHQSSILIDSQITEQNQDKTITIQYEKESIVLKYAAVADFTLMQVLKGYLKIEEISSYILVFSGLIVYSNQKMKKLEEDPEFDRPIISVIIIKNQKLSFLHAANITSQNIKSFSSILFEHKQDLSSLPQKSSIQVKIPNQIKGKLKRAEESLLAGNINNFFKKEYFYLPFLLFTSRVFNEQIYRNIRRFDEHKKQAHSPTSLFAIVRDLYCNLNWLQNYQRYCHYGLRNFKASLFFNPGHTFYFYSFTVAYKQYHKVAQQLQNNAGTLFYIQSTNGKLISRFSMFPEKNQILFAPFTYFLVERVKAGVQYDEVWLTQIASPVTFRKDIILWVDDNPHYNTKQYDYILHVKKNIEILQVTSTQAAEKWIKQFGWILSWKGLRFKLISDMGRWQWRGENKVENKEAGIDLLEMLYKVKGYSTKTMIFCGDEEKAEKLASDRNIPKQKYQITEREEQLQPYVEING